MKLSEYTVMRKRFGVMFTLKEIYYRFFSNILEKRVNQKRDRDTLRYLKRYLLKTVSTSDCFNPIKDLKPCIWTCWLQGYNNAPPIVKACINSMRKYSGDYGVIVLTEETIIDYVSMPNFIIKKYKAGIISKTQFSDLLRTLILINYGGVWLDATVMLTQQIPRTLLSQGLFMFQSSVLHNEIQPCSSWFIAAKKNNPILQKVFEILASYWNKNNKLINYFIFHVTVQLVITYDNELKCLWKKMFYKNNSDPHFLQKILFDDFDLNIKDYIWNLSFAHKLTYKFNDDKLTERLGTYYSHIIETMDKQ
jgi:mannosyltransferase OCH1-like enzyme